MGTANCVKRTTTPFRICYAFARDMPRSEDKRCDIFERKEEISDVDVAPPFDELFSRMKILKPIGRDFF